MSRYWLGGEGPGDIPEWAYRYLVLTLKVDPDELGRLKCLEQVNFEGDAPVDVIRIFDPDAAVKTARVSDFASLDSSPGLIRYEGYRERKTGRIGIARGPLGDE